MQWDCPLGDLTGHNGGLSISLARSIHGGFVDSKRCPRERCQQKSSSSITAKIQILLTAQKCRVSPAYKKKSTLELSMDVGGCVWKALWNQMKSSQICEVLSLESGNMRQFIWTNSVSIYQLMALQHLNHHNMAIYLLAKDNLSHCMKSSRNIWTPILILTPCENLIFHYEGNYLLYNIPWSET